MIQNTVCVASLPLLISFTSSCVRIRLENRRSALSCRWLFWFSLYLSLFSLTLLISPIRNTGNGRYRWFYTFLFPFLSFFPAVACFSPERKVEGTCQCQQHHLLSAEVMQPSLTLPWVLQRWGRLRLLDLLLDVELFVSLSVWTSLIVCGEVWVYERLQKLQLLYHLSLEQPFHLPFIILLTKTQLQNLPYIFFSLWLNILPVYNFYYYCFLQLVLSFFSTHITALTVLRGAAGNHFCLRKFAAQMDEKINTVRGPPYWFT